MILNQLFYISDQTFRGGVRSLLQCAGLGKLRPNTLVIGYMNRWQLAEQSKVDQYFNIINDAFGLRYGVGILRLQDGLDITDGDVDDEVENDGIVENHEPDWYTEAWDESQKPTLQTQGTFFWLFEVIYIRWYGLYRIPANYHTIHRKTINYSVF